MSKGCLKAPSPKLHSYGELVTYILSFKRFYDNKILNQLFYVKFLKKAF